MNPWGRRAACVSGLMLAVVSFAGHAAPRAAADVNCSAFATQAAAQSYYIAHGGPAQDPDHLDGDRNGIACQSLPCPCSSATGTAPVPTTTATPVPTPTPVPTATPVPRISPGPSKPLTAVRRSSGCHVNGPPPHPPCTPRAPFTRGTKDDVCRARHSRPGRKRSTSLKDTRHNP